MAWEAKAEVLQRRASKRVGVLTFHRSINYGSYWQARCLVEGLTGMGHEAVLLEHRSTAVTRAEYKCALQPTLPVPTARFDFPAYKARARKVLAAADALPLSAPFDLDAPSLSEAFDMVVVGSDEVWNMRHPWYGGKALFYGYGVEAERRVAYAASFGAQDAAEGLEPWWADRLRGFDSLSVRDDNSRRMIQDQIGIDPALVLDPCLQFPPSLLPTGAEERPYVALYGHSFPQAFGEGVRRWAEARGLALVSIGYRNPYADTQHIDAGPDEFAALIAGAAAVATNFFHGCVFSLLADKPFVLASSAYRANKLRDLTRAVGAEERLLGEDAPAHAFKLLGTPLAPAVAERIAALRTQSSAFLAHALA